MSRCHIRCGGCRQAIRRSAVYGFQIITHSAVDVPAHNKVVGIFRFKWHHAARRVVFCIIRGIFVSLPDLGVCHIVGARCYASNPQSAPKLCRGNRCGGYVVEIDFDYANIASAIISFEIISQNVEAYVAWIAETNPILPLLGY